MARTPPEPLVEDRIVELVEHPDRRITRAILRSWGEAGATLMRWGALKNGETLTSLICEACDDHHIVDLEYDPVAGAWRHYCGSAGFVTVDADDLVTFRFDLRWLVDRLADGLLIGRPRHRDLVPDVLWDLGDAGLGGRNWSAFLARTVDAQLDPILVALRSRGGKLSGLVLTSSPFPPVNVSLPHGHRFMPLRAALDGATGVLEVDHQTVLAELRPGRLGKGERPVGRPSSRARVLELFERRQRAGQTAKELVEEAGAIRELMMLEEPSQRAPATGTIQNIVRDILKEVQGKAPRPTK
jgi:hypothetical protein